MRSANPGCSCSRIRPFLPNRFLARTKPYLTAGKYSVWATCIMVREPPTGRQVERKLAGKYKGPEIKAYPPFCRIFCSFQENRPLSFPLPSNLFVKQRGKLCDSGFTIASLLHQHYFGVSAT